MEERLRILKMVEDGTISAKEAADLMDALEAPNQTGLIKPAKNYDKKLFRILVDGTQGGDKVKIQFPIGAVKRILKVTGKLPIPEESLKGMDLQAMMDAVIDCLDEELEGDFINVSAADGTNVRIFVE